MSASSASPPALHGRERPSRFPFTSRTPTLTTVIPLRREFRFTHEPIPVPQSQVLRVADQSVTVHRVSRFIGRRDELEALAQRILFSNGGSFLITGYRGVGKTSFVHEVLRQVEQALPWASSFLGPVQLLDVYLNLARPLEPA